MMGPSLLQIPRLLYLGTSIIETPVWVGPSQLLNRRFVCNACTSDSKYGGGVEIRMGFSWLSGTPRSSRSVWVNSEPLGIGLKWKSHVPD